MQKFYNMSHLTKIHHDLVLKSYFDYLNSHFIVISFKYFWPAFNICPQIDGKKEKKLVRSNEVRKKKLFQIELSKYKRRHTHKC